VPIPQGLRRALWTAQLVQLFWAIWLVTIVTGHSSCDGPICTVATLHHHAAALLACTDTSPARPTVPLVPTCRLEVVAMLMANSRADAGETVETTRPPPLDGHWLDMVAVA
jgi:hypothetical protein